MPNRKSKNNSGPYSPFTEEYKDFIKILLDDHPQLIVDDIIVEVTKQFQGFSILQPHLIHDWKNIIQITTKNPHFVAEARYSSVNL